MQPQLDKRTSGCHRPTKPILPSGSPHDHRRQSQPQPRARTFPTISPPSGCRSRRTAPSRSGRASSRVRRTCTTTRPRGARSSTRRRRCGAATPATTAPPIVAAIQRQAAELDFSPTFQFAHPLAFQLSSRLAELAPADLDHVFFTNSGSEAADTALKIAIAYHNVRGAGLAPAPDRARARLSRRRLRRHLGRRHGQQPEILRLAHRRRRPSAGDLQPRASGLHQGRAGMGRPSRRRARGHRRPARRLHHRRRHRRADGGLDRRAAAAERLSPAPARDLRQIRHPAHLRRGHHRLRPARRAPSPRSATASFPT